jgi:glycosyltransferase involved in cell wall biosynthesis
MRFLFLEQFSELGGGQRNLLDLLPAVMDQGWSAVVGAPGSGELLERARALGAHTAEVPVGIYANGHKTAVDVARLPVDVMRLQRWIARADADVISVGGARLLMAASLGSRGRPVVFQAQHFLSDESFAGHRAVRLAGWAIRRAGMTVVANSEHVARQFRKFGDVRVVYNGVGEIPFARRGRVGEWRIGIIGRIAPMKGQTDFLRAAAILCGAKSGSVHGLGSFGDGVRTGGDRFRFIVCGSPMFGPESYVNEVHGLAEGLPVEFTGWREDVGEVLRELDLLLVPSTSAEATTRVILEAFSAGVPVVAYAVGGIPEIVRDGENGFLARERSPESLAERVKEAMATDLDLIARRARVEWERRFTLKRYRDEMVMVYRAEMKALSVAGSRE